MTVMDYFGLALAAIMLLLGLPSIFGFARAPSRDRGWFYVLAATAVLMLIMLDHSDLPGEDWLRWIAPVLLTIGVAIRASGLVMRWKRYRQARADRTGTN